MPKACELGFPEWLNRSVWHFDAPLNDYAECSLLFVITGIGAAVALIVLSLCVKFPAILLFIGSIALLVGAALGLRFMRDTKKSINKITKQQEEE